MAIGVIGLGNIGRGIATNLVADGSDVVVYDVDAAAMAAIAGATAAPDVAGVAKAADVTLLSLPTPDVVAQVAAAWAGAAVPGAVLVDLSTNSPAVVRQLGERLAGSGHHLVEAPLTGGAIGAEKRMLMFMVGGADEPVARVLPGARAARAGHLPRRTAGARQHDEAAQQPHRLHHHLGEPGGTGHGHQGRHRAARRRWRSCAPGARPTSSSTARSRPSTGATGPTQFALELAAKDAGLIVDTGSAVGAPTPVGAAIKGVLDTVVAEGLGGADWSELVTFAERQADVALRWNAE